MALKSLTPNLMVKDLHASMDFWCGKLGFSFAMGVDAAHSFLQAYDPSADLVWAQLARDGVELMLQRADNLPGDVPEFAGRPTGGTITLYLQVDDLEALHARLHDAVPTVTPLRTQFYGMREWYIRDPDGYVVTLGQQAQG